MTDKENVVWLAFADKGMSMVVKGPYTEESIAVESVAKDYDTYHVEPRRVKDEVGDCVANDVMPTY